MRPALVTQRLVREANDEERDCLDVRWTPFLARVGLCVVPAPSAADPVVLMDLLRPAALVLSGGNDLDALSPDPLNARRDVFEIALLRLALSRDVPVLGVCRGAQLMAWSAGASLRRVDGHVASEHAIAPVAGARFGAAFARTANSYHRWGFGPFESASWRVAALADDGSAEAIEHRERRAVGILWHPERYQTPREADLALVEEVLR